MNFSSENLKDCIEEATTDGFVFVGKNNTGKTYQMEKIISEIFKDDLISNPEYRINKYLFLSKKIIQGSIELKGVRGLGSIVELPEKGEDTKIDVKNDMVNGISIAEGIFNSIEKETNFIEEIVKIKLKKEENTIEIEDGSERGWYPLKSSGYLSLIRLVVLLNRYLDANVKYIFLDEPDSALDTEKREHFLYIIEEIKRRKNSKAKVILSSHNSETLFTLPDNYMIFQMVNKFNIKSYFSQDFFSKPKLEEVLFNEYKRIYKSRQDMELLKDAYVKALTGTKTDKASLDDKLSKNYNELSIKEKIIYNAIMKIGG